MKANTILDTIGNTPHVKINHLFRPDIEVWMKVERFNPGSSIKDRIALAMIDDAEASGKLKSGSVIIEPTSGNTGIGLAMVAAVRGYRLILTMPESMSVERRMIMQAMGAELVLTEKEKGMPGAIDKAFELLDEVDNSWMPQQFNNASNPRVHREITTQEILTDFPEGFDYLITGVGTGGHITGCSEALKASFPHMQTLAVEPQQSAVISGGEKGPHRLQGIGAGFIPEVLNTDTLDGIIKVSEEDSFAMTRECARKEAIFVGISSGATLAAVKQKQAELAPGSRILVFSYDTGERYLSVDGLFNH
ncbi:MAG: cysteine synthase A [Gammaproteobacteria bacterium]|nr:cysteine synthase A [Gammaproteobacteria bacterium]